MREFVAIVVTIGRVWLAMLALFAAGALMGWAAVDLANIVYTATGNTMAGAAALVAVLLLGLSVFIAAYTYRPQAGVTQGTADADA